ncbi:MAG: hypothetical protein MH137_02330, partial [Flavobacteriales bacterium]|nr:hypothetical protein [Flavobacteriales bacterium]
MNQKIPQLFKGLRRVLDNTVRMSLMKVTLIASVLVLSYQQSHSQCNNLTAFGSGAAPAAGATVTLTTCAYAGEYSTITAVAAATQYISTSTGGAGNYITIRQGTPGGTVIAHGPSPLNWTSTVAGTYYHHVNTNISCGTDASCHTNTIQRPIVPAGCNNPTAFGSGVAPAAGATVTLTTCAYAGEYS